jgi:hypothetical protein
VRATESALRIELGIAAMEALSEFAVDPPGLIYHPPGEEGRRYRLLD